jgi:hypothetical protein
MHGFHATSSPCSYGLVMFPVSWAIAAVILTIVLLID